jgi:hypothetical protein
VDAMTFDLTPETSLDCDITFKYGIGFRVADRDSDKLSSVNSDDANRNFDKWDMINNRISLLGDIEFKHKNYVLFVRPKVMYDQVYHSSNANDSPLTNNAYQAGKIGSTDEWSDEVKDVHGFNAEILDAYASTSLDIGGHYTNFRVGRQTIQWGESLLLTGISGAMAHTDYDAATAAGTEVKEMLLPSESVFIQTELTDAISFEAYYQFKWYHHKFMEAGTYFSQADILDDAGYVLLYGAGVPGLYRGEDQDADDQGQYGFAMHYVADWLASTDFGLYYINYHAKAPVGPAMDLTAGTFAWVYPENMKVFGFSFGTLVGDTSITGEFHYHKDHYYGIDDKDDYWQAQTSWYLSGAAAPIADSYSFLGEFAFVNSREIDVPENKKLGSRISVRGGLDWLSVVTNLDMGFDIAFADKLVENKIIGGDENSTLGLILDFTYKSVYKYEIRYQNEMGGDNYASDRDWVKMSFSYTF